MEDYEEGTRAEGDDGKEYVFKEGAWKEYDPYTDQRADTALANARASGMMSMPPVMPTGTAATYANPIRENIMSWAGSAAGGKGASAMPKIVAKTADMAKASLTEKLSELGVAKATGYLGVGSWGINEAMQAVSDWMSD